MQHLTFTNRPFAYSSFCLTILFTTFGIALVTFISTSWALVKELDTPSAQQATITAFQPAQSSPLSNKPPASQSIASIAGGAATTAVSYGISTQKSNALKAVQATRIPSMNALKDDILLSPFEPAKTPQAIENAAPAKLSSLQVAPAVLDKATLAQNVSKLADEREVQRQRAVVQFLIARPSTLQVQTPKHQWVTFKSVDHKTSKQASLYVNQSEVLQFRSSLGFLTPYLRSKQAAHRLQLFVKNNGNYNDIQVVTSDAGVLLKMGETTIATVDAVTAQALGVSVESLADTWKQKLRSALGETTASATPEWVKKPIQQSGRFLAQGLASWYGPGFHGRLAADGSRFNQNAMTAAHKTLPFGTKLLVTNQNTGKSCVVKITDRGPFVGHRVIDLSKGAAAAIGMLGSGVGKVSLHVLK